MSEFVIPEHFVYANSIKNIKRILFQQTMLSHEYFRDLSEFIVQRYLLCLIALQGQGSDYYRIYGEKDGTTKEYHHDVAYDG